MNHKTTSGIVRVLQEARGYHFLAAALVMNLGEGICEAMIAAQGGKMLDAFLAANRQAAGQRMLVILLYVILVGVFIFAKDSLLGIYQEKGILRLRRRTVEAVSHARFSWLEARHTGELSARASNDLSALGTALRPVLIMGISVLIHEAVAVGYLFSVNWRLTLIMFAAVPVTMALQWLYSRPIARYRAANQDALGSLSAVVYDTLGSFESVKSLGLEPAMQCRFAKAQQQQCKSALEENRVVALLSPLSGLGRYVPQFVLVLAGGLYVIDGAMSLGQMAVFLALSSSAVATVGGVAELFGSIRQLGACADRITELWEVEAEPAGGLADPPETWRDSLVFDHVSFAYGRKEHSALRDVSIRIPRGAFVALVGGSGCGKSTAIKLAATLYEPDRGAITTMGRADADWELSALRNQIAYVAQDTFLFPGTLRENVTAGQREGAHTAAFCLEAAQLRELVASRPEGEEADVGERGALLSGGQRQRIAIARALYKGAELLLLDEATSALDCTTEAAVMRGIMDMPGRPTVLMITHRLVNARNADFILVMRDGQICERGTHSELVERGGIYHALLERQREEVLF